MGRKKTDLSDKQILAATAIARGSTREEAAREANVHPRTIFKWLSRDDFILAVESMRSAQFDAVIGGLANSVHKAQLFLERMMDGTIEGENLPLRLRAAQSLFTGATSLSRHQQNQDQRNNTLSLLEAHRMAQIFVDSVTQEISDPELRRRLSMTIAKMFDEEEQIRSKLSSSQSIRRHNHVIGKDTINC